MDLRRGQHPGVAAAVGSLYISTVGRIEWPVSMPLAGREA